MAYIEIFPKSAEAQRRLTDDINPVMDILSQATKQILKVPDHDIIVELNQCTTLAFNPLAVENGAIPDVVIKISTSDHDLQPDFEALSEQIINRWSTHFGSSLKTELWISLIETWRCNMDLQ